MIKLNYYVRRKPGLSAADFRHHWEETHGMLWEMYAEDLGVRRYTQVYDDPEHPVAERFHEGYGVSGDSYDGLSVACWAEIGVLEAALKTERGKAAWEKILSDEAEFIDHDRSMLSFGTDHPVISPHGKLLASEDSNLVRGAYFPEALPGIELDEVHRHWIAVHGGLASDFSENSENIRYFQVHRYDHPIAENMRQTRGMQTNQRYFGHAEVWTDLARMAEGSKQPRAAEVTPLYVADIEAFCDMNSGYFIIGKEKHFVDKDIYTLPMPKPQFAKPESQKTGT